MVNIQNFFDDAKCFQTVRDMRWPDGVACPSCGSTSAVKNGLETPSPTAGVMSAGLPQTLRRSGSAFAGHHLPLRDWVASLYLMVLNLSDLQILREVGIDKSDARDMITTLRQGVVHRTLRRNSPARSSATKSMSWPGTRAIPRRSKKRPSRPPTTPEGGPVPRDAREGEAADLRYAPARRPGRDPDASERSAGHDPPLGRGDDRAGDADPYQRVRHRQSAGGIGISA